MSLLIENTLICAFTSRHFTAISSFFSSTMTSSLAGKNMVMGITAGEGRSRSALDSSLLMDLEENIVSVSRSS